MPRAALVVDEDEALAEGLVLEVEATPALGLTAEVVAAGREGAGFGFLGRLELEFEVVSDGARVPSPTPCSRPDEVAARGGRLMIE